MSEIKPPSITHIENKLWVVTEKIDMAQYDFRFEDHFVCSHPYQLEKEIVAIARMGATNDYPGRYKDLKELGINLVHTPDQYQLTSNLLKWYPLIEDLTPKSIWYENLPSVAEIENDFKWPVFIKGERQTSKHDKSKSIIESPDQYNELIDIWRNDSILHWQKPVVREFVPLKPVTKEISSLFPKSFEFRTFWWKTECVGIGPYWFSESYSPSPQDTVELIRIGSKVATRLKVNFLVIDIAQAKTGEWIVIECNDGQDSGYAGVNPRNMWQKILDKI